MFWLTGTCWVFILSFHWFLCSSVLWHLPSLSPRLFLFWWTQNPDTFLPLVLVFFFIRLKIKTNFFTRRHFVLYRSWVNNAILVGNPFLIYSRTPPRHNVESHPNSSWIYCRILLTDEIERCDCHFLLRILGHQRLAGFYELFPFEMWCILYTYICISMFSEKLVNYIYIFGSVPRQSTHQDTSRQSTHQDTSQISTF